MLAPARLRSVDLRPAKRAFGLQPRLSDLALSGLCKPGKELKQVCDPYRKGLGIAFEIRWGREKYVKVLRGSDQSIVEILQGRGGLVIAELEIDCGEHGPDGAALEEEKEDRKVPPPKTSR